MLYSSIIINQLGKDLSDQVGKRLNTTNYHKYCTLEQLEEFCKSNWTILQTLYDKLIDLNELDTLNSKRKLGKWHYFSLIAGVPDTDLLKD
jgi:hypothetical protein